MHLFRHRNCIMMNFMLIVITLTCIAGCGRQRPTPAPPAATYTVAPPPTLTPNPDAVVNARVLNVRDGPGTNYRLRNPVVFGDTLRIVGQAQNCTWLLVITPKNDTGWVSAEYVDLAIACGNIALVSTPPLPTFTATIAPPLVPATATATPTAIILEPAVTPTDTPVPIILTPTPTRRPGHFDPPVAATPVDPILE